VHVVGVGEHARQLVAAEDALRRRRRGVARVTHMSNLALNLSRSSEHRPEHQALVLDGGA
jgi:hypothetical protein